MVAQIEQEESILCGIAVKAKEYHVRDGRIEVDLVDITGKAVGFTSYDLSHFEGGLYED